MSRSVISNYDSANRLTGVSGPSGTTTYAYNGLGERLQQTVGGVTTTYLVDLEGGLSQVLSDGTNEYLYGSGRILQANASDTQYFLGDALGSVRQLADAGGSVSLAKGYDPFGNAGWSAGAAQTPYGYTAEQTDANGLVYLRARFYSTEAGRFLSKDTWVGNYNQPFSLNRWNYVGGNPINYKDPTGHIEEGKEATVADDIWKLLNNHGISIEKDWGDIYDYDQIMKTIFKCGWNKGRWDINELGYILEASNNVQNVLGGWYKLHSAVGNITVNKIDIDQSAMAPPYGSSDYVGDILFLESGTELNKERYKYHFAHEFAHVWDYREGNRLSFNLMKRLGTWNCPDEYIKLPIIPLNCWTPQARHIDGNGRVILPEPPPDTPNWYRPEMGINPAYSLTYGNLEISPLIEYPGWEDWAVSFGHFVYSKYYLTEGTIGLRNSPIRRQYVAEQITRIR